MADREEQISEWISKEDLRKRKQKERRKKIIPSSTDSITHTPVGDPLDAMAKIACYFGDHPELPIVEMGLIDETSIGLSFGVDYELEYPFLRESEDDGSHWKISHRDALSLSTGDTYGWQTAALTAIGNSASGGKMLLNTNRWHVLGLGGLDQFISAVMVGQVMEHATEPWTAEHHIWLVGYRELGPKLVNFLTSYHDHSYFHLVETVEQITTNDIAGTTATLYVKNSNAATLEAFKRLRADNPNNVGMLTDTIVTEQAMFISENDDGSAAICNAAPHSIQFWPNIIGENHKLYMAMEIHWEKHQVEAEKARQAVESVTMADFLPAEPEKAPAPVDEERTGATSISNISAEDLEAMFNSGTAKRDTPAPTPAQIEAQAEVEAALTDAAAAVAQAEIVADDAEAIAAQAKVEAESIQAPAEPAPAPAGTEPAPAAAQAPLSLLGQPKLHGADGALVEAKPAEAVAYLHLSGLFRDGVEVSQALWPEADNEGGAARARRTRTTKTIREALPGTFRVEGGQWIIDPLTTDLDQLLSALASDGDPQETVRACEAIEAPLQGCATWADEPRAQIVSQLREVLEGVMDRALDHDQFEIVKAVRQAIKKL
ncbi:hypothetical protein IWX65_002716 [Arthrobacter sp. CAN_A214]|uniref:hypothetical protein n=1 Tax=Arthrobacter sp. CAN_A214 TaxID=2787720 RepID=UPI0018C9BE69